jgi:hypothetical protein
MVHIYTTNRGIRWTHRMWWVETPWVLVLVNTTCGGPLVKFAKPPRG